MCVCLYVRQCVSVSKTLSCVSVCVYVCVCVCVYVCATRRVDIYSYRPLLYRDLGLGLLQVFFE